LSLSQLSSYSGPARFRLVRDAGTFNFEGQLRDGHGTGFFTFSPDSRFPSLDDLQELRESRRM